MSASNFKINPDFKIQTFYVGAEKTPLLIIDDVLANPQATIDHACTAAVFSHEQASYYPGIRAELSRDYGYAVLTAIAKIVYDFFSIPAQLKIIPQDGAYSLVTCPPEQLSPPQCRPHFDSTEPRYLAITHYLNPGDFGGTSFYRHRSTGYENITASRLEKYNAATEAYFDQHGGESPRRYFVGSDDQYESLGSSRYQPNRLLAYPGTLLHSGDIDAARDICSDPASGRLTANMFIDFQ